jgi:hypothetical protein
MPDHTPDNVQESRRRRLRGVFGNLLVVAVLAAAVPMAALAAPPVESCGPGDTTTAAGFRVCGGTSGGGGGLFNLGGLLPIVGVALLIGLGVVALAFLALERRVRRQLAPAQPGEWWTCRNCGKSNLVGTPRCYACGAWQG